MMKRVLHVNDYPADGPGGAEVMMRRTTALLTEAGWRVETFTHADLPDQRRSLNRYLHNSVASRALADKLERFQPDVVHLHNFYHLLSPGILEALEHERRTRPYRTIMTAHDYHLVCPNSGGRWYCGRQPVSIDPARLGSLWYCLTRRWDERSLAFSFVKLLQHFWNYRWKNLAHVLDAIICPSRFSQSLLEGRFANTIVLPHPVPAFAGSGGPRPANLELVHVGRLEPEKGLREFLEMLPASFAGNLTVVGEGSMRPVCERLCRKRNLQDRVRFLGRLPHAQAIERIARAHVLVQPSRFLESYGLSLVEALSVGTNVLVSDQGAMREIVESAGVGYVFDMDSAESLRIQLERIERDFAADSLLRFDLSNFVREHSESAYLGRLLDIYAGEAILAPSRKAA